MPRTRHKLARLVKEFSFWPDRSLSWKTSHPITLKPREHILFEHEAPDVPGRRLWRFRQILDCTNHLPGSFPGDITVVNWPQVDYWLGPIAEVPPEAAGLHLEQSKQISLSFLYWMQTEAPRPDGGTGYPSLKLRPDAMDTKDGLAKYPYIRESRRIRAEFTVCEQHVAAALRPDGAEKFGDSVGVGCYRIDLHPSTGGDNYIDIGC